MYVPELQPQKGQTVQGRCHQTTHPDKHDISVAVAWDRSKHVQLIYYLKTSCKLGLVSHTVLGRQVLRKMVLVRDFMEMEKTKTCLQFLLVCVKNNK